MVSVFENPVPNTFNARRAPAGVGFGDSEVIAGPAEIVNVCAFEIGPALDGKFWTATDAVPGLASNDAGMVTVIDVLLFPAAGVSVVVVDPTVQRTCGVPDADVPKLLPLITRLNDGEPARAEFGASEVVTGLRTVNTNPLDVCPLMVTVMVPVPAVFTRDAGICTAALVALGLATGVNGVVPFQK